MIFKKISPWLLFFVISLSSLLPQSFAQESASPTPPPLVLSQDELQYELKEISKTLRCAVCQSESVWESNATLAIQMRDIIMERLLEGENGDQIRAYFVSRYGEYIVFKPRFGGLNLILWLGPFVLLIIGGFVLYNLMQKWTKQKKQVAAEGEPPLDPDLKPIDEAQRKRIEDELQSFR